MKRPHVVEPSSYSGYGNITYSYYGDDMRASLAISSSAIPASTSWQYGYRVDGLPEVVKPSWASSNPFVFQYTAGGRPTTETDPSTGSTITIYNAVSGASTGTSRTLVQRSASYDPYGRITKLELPEGYTYSAFSYDGEDEPTGYTFSNGLCNNSYGTVSACATTSATHTYSSRGELLDGRDSADGFLCTANGSGGCTEGFDSRSDLLISSGGFTYGYDGAGEQTTVTKGGTITRTFDADGHLVSEANNSSATVSCYGGYAYGCDPDNNWVDIGSAATYTWGTNGHPVKLTQNLYGGGPSYVATYWEHWDPSSGQALFETGNGGNTIALGGLGVSNASSGVTVEDRDPFGQIAATHTGLEFSAWSEAPAARPMGRYGYYTSGAIGSAYPGTDPQEVGRYLDHQRPDAFIDDTYGVSFQGVRTADANTGVWMEPDAFGGYQSDVLSQQPYLWDNNNWLMYGDPSGFCDNGWTQDANGNTIAAPDDGWCVPPPDDGDFGDLGLMLGALGFGLGPWDQIGVFIRPIVTSVQKPCVRAALGEGALSVGIDALGLIPEAGGVARMVGHQFGYYGIVADRQGTNVIRAIGSSSSLMLGLAGIANGGSEHYVSTALTVAGFVPGLGQITAGASIVNDSISTGLAISKCR